MPSIDEYPLRADGESPPPDERNSSTKWIVLAGLLVVAAIVAAVILLRSPSPEEAPVTATTAQTEQSAEAVTLPPLGSAPEETELPPLDLTDPVVRELLRGLSSRPELVAWLATDNLLRHGVAAVDNVARGRTPTSHFRAVAPGAAFSATPSNNGRFTISQQAHARYNGIAQTIDSLDAQGVSSAYATLRPRMIEAYRELGYPDGNIDGAVQRAIVHLLQTPDVAEDAPVEPSAVMYKYVDPRLEGLSPAQKQLLRMGPGNVRIVKQKLREIALALGIPSEQLPPARES
jgi:hypothetical protein